MSGYKLLAQRIGLLGISNVLFNISGIILLPILTKSLSVENYGIWVQVGVTVGLLPILINLGLSNSMIRYLAAEKKREGIQEGFYSITITILFSSLIVTACILLLSEQIAGILFNNNLFVSRMLPIIILLECLNLNILVFFRTMHQIKRYSLFQVAKTYLNVALVGFFVVSGYDIFGAMIGLLISTAVSFLVMTFLVVYEIGFKIPKFNKLREYFAFGLPTLPGNLSWWVTSSSDRYIIGIFLGSAFVGYYQPAYVLGNIITMFSAPMQLFLPAALSKYYDEGRVPDVESVLSHSMKYFLALAIPSTFGLSLLSKPLLTILSTSEIASTGYLVTPFVASSALLAGSITIFSHVIIIQKKTNLIGLTWAMAAVVNIGLNLIFVPLIGILGAAITTLLAFLIAFMMMARYSRKYLPFNIDIRFISKSLMASVVMSVLILLLDPIGICEVFATVGICAGVYLFILFLLGGFDRREMEFFRELFRL